MKAIVEWGIPTAATVHKVCGIVGEHVVANPKQASELGRKLFHSQTHGMERGRYHPTHFTPTKDQPRKVVWAEDNSSWVAVSLLDGVARGAYAGVAERDYRERIKAAQKEAPAK